MFLRSIILYELVNLELDMKRHNGKLVKLFEKNKYDRLLNENTKSKYLSDSLIVRSVS